MFLMRRPARHTVDRFLQDAAHASLSYGPVGLVREAGATNRRVDEITIAIGRGAEDFGRARAALMAWRQFDIGWVEAFPACAPVVVGTNVAVLIRHLGFWSLNGARVLYCVGDPVTGSRFGYAYGTLTSHAESGEELFEVFLDRHTDDVIYRIRATSWAQAPLARVGQPIVRLLQARFRRDSTAAMQRAVRSAS
jgi:uncharacterized protein (UPF0548 family)